MEKKRNMRKRIFALISVCMVFILTFGMMLEEAYAYTLNYVVKIKNITDASGTPITAIDPNTSNVVITASYGSTKTSSDPPLKVSGTGNIEGKFTDLSDTEAKTVSLSITSVSLNGAKGTAKSDYGTTIEYKEGDTTPATFSGIDLQIKAIDPSSQTVKKADNRTGSFDRSDFSVSTSDLDDAKAKKIMIYNYNKNNGDNDVRRFVDKNTGKEFSMLFIIKNDVDSSAKDKIKDWVKNSSDNKDATVDDNKFFDVSLYLCCGDASDENNRVKITDTGSDNKVTIKVKFNSDFKKSSRHFYLIKEHEGSVSCPDDGTGSELSVKTNELSAFNVAYKDSSSSSSSKSSSSSSKSSSSLSPSTGGGGGSTTTSGKSPKTGDDFSFLKWLYFVLIGGTIIYSSVTLLKDTHDDVDE